MMATGHTIHYVVDALFVVCDNLVLLFSLLHFLLRLLMSMASVSLHSLYQY